ncbi:MAG TPA: MDR family MFS transporter [Clostridia bacterium]|nr:MDR family MFS transporter [Clostridia bacterium]
MIQKQISGRKLALILAGVMASLLLSALDSTIVSTAMKKTVETLGGMKYYSWPFTIYMLCSTLTIPICGGLSDIYDHKPMFVIGISVFLAGSVLCGISQSMLQLIIFRGLQGIGGGMIVTSVFTVVADLFEPAKRGKFTGIVTSMYGLASIIGPLSGGFITDHFGWRWIFFINIPLGIAAVALIVVTMPGFKSGETKKQVDFIGIIVLVLALTPLLLDLSMSGDNFAWFSFPCISMFVITGLMLSVFIMVEKRVANPLIPLSFFKDRAISISFLISFLSQAMMFSAIMYLPYFVQGIIGSTATTSGAVVTPMMLGLLFSSNVTGFLVSKFGKARVLSVAAFTIMAAGALLLSTMGSGTTYSWAILFMVILGVGVGICMPITNVNAQNAVAKQQIGSVTSAVMFFRNMGSTIGSAVFGVIMARSLSSGLSGLNMQRLPEKVQGMLKNTQTLTNAKAIASIRANVPKAYTGYFESIYLQAKDVLAHSIHNVFLFCVPIALLGLIVAIFLREADMEAKELQG